MAIAPLTSFADVQQFLNTVSSQHGNSNSQAPHGAFWSTLTYQDFIGGNVPKVTPDYVQTNVPILKVGNSAQSNIILALRGQGTLFGPNGSVPQMPADGTLWTDDQIDALAAWIDAGCPEFAKT